MQSHVEPDFCRAMEMFSNGFLSPFSDERTAAFRAAYRPHQFDRETLLSERYLLAREGRHAVYFAPLAAWPRESAKIIFVGLTPGFSQMKLAAELFMEQPPGERGESHAYGDALRERVAFAGQMRTNLCQMLDAIGLAHAMGVFSTTALFAYGCESVATTSALVYPTCTQGNNFAGPREGERVRMFDDLLGTQLLPRLARAPKAVIIPLGRGVEKLLERPASRADSLADVIGRHRILFGLPHPSPANGHRLGQFAHNRASLEGQIAELFDESVRPERRFGDRRSGAFAGPPTGFAFPASRRNGY